MTYHTSLKSIERESKADSSYKNAFKESNGIYGYRNIHKDLLASGISANKKRV